MITVERLDTIEQDLKWARDNADRSAQTRLFIHHIPFLLTILRPVAEEMDAYLAEEEAYLAEQVKTEESTEDAADSESETETVGLASRVKEFLSPSDEADATDSQVDAEGDATDSQVDDESQADDESQVDDRELADDEKLDAVEEITE